MLSDQQDQNAFFKIDHLLHQLEIPLLIASSQLLSIPSSAVSHEWFGLKPDCIWMVLNVTVTCWEWGP